MGGLVLKIMKRGDGPHCSGIHGICTIRAEKKHVSLGCISSYNGIAGARKIVSVKKRRRLLWA
jgi:hypothetical protein